MTSKKQKAGRKKSGLEAISESSESSESHPTENSSSSISSPRPRPRPPSTSIATATATSSSTSTLHSSSHPSSQSSSSNIRPGSQAHSHPTSSARPSSSSSSSTSQPPSSSTRACAACCTSACCSSAKPPSSSSRPRGTRSVSPNPLLPSIPPPTRRPRTMTKNKSSSSSRQKAKTAPDSKAKLGDPGADKYLRDKHRLELRTLELHPEDWLAPAFPLRLRPFLEGPPLEVVRCIYKDKGQLYLMMQKFINEAKDGASHLHIIIFKPVPLSVIQNDKAWDYNIAPHCRFTYLEAQQTLVMNIATETRMIEHLPKTKLNFDDTDMGVQGHALGRFKYGLKKQLSAMGIVDNRWEFACCKSRHSHGLIFDVKDTVQNKSIHTADRMFIPGIIRHPKYDADHQPWPTMVIECCTDFTNLASRLYIDYCADWWFGQSEGFTKYVILMMFDYTHHTTLVEKWVCAPEAPFTKKLAQTIMINLKRDAMGKLTVVVDGEDLVLDFESLMARPKREGESDIVFDKALLNGFGNGFLVPWPNLGRDRKKNVKGSGIDVATARKLLNYPLSTLKQQLGPALAEALKKAEEAAKAVGADADMQGSRMTLTLTRNKVDKGKGKEKESGELSSGEDRIPVDITIGEALAIMAEKEEVEEKK